MDSTRAGSGLYYWFISEKKNATEKMNVKIVNCFVIKKKKWQSNGGLNGTNMKWQPANHITQPIKHCISQ